MSRDDARCPAVKVASNLLSGDASEVPEVATAVPPMLYPGSCPNGDTDGCALAPSHAACCQTPSLCLEHLVRREIVFVFSSCLTLRKDRDEAVKAGLSSFDPLPFALRFRCREGRLLHTQEVTCHGISVLHWGTGTRCEVKLIYCISRRAAF